MSRRRQPPPLRKTVRWHISRRHAVWATLLVAVVALALFARTSCSMWAKRTAINRLQAGAISDARQYLQRAAWCTPDDGTIDIMLAFCFRQFRQVDQWKDAIQAAEKKGIPRTRIERESQLYRIQTGDWPAGVELQLAEFAGEGLTTYDVPAAFVTGCLANGRNGLAEQILDAWSADFPNDAHVAYMRGKLAESIGNGQQARTHFETAVSLEPRHELAHDSLGKMFEQDDQLPRAFEQYAALASASPASEVAAVGAARILRSLGHADRAQGILEPFSRVAEPSIAVAVEMGRIAMDRGEYSRAEQWFERAGLKQSRDPRLLISAVRLLGLEGKSSEAERLFQRVAAVGDRVTRTNDLRTRLKLDPGNGAAVAEIEQLYQSLNAKLTSLENPEPEVTGAEMPSPGRRLFLLHCNACHGSEGAGNGRAARHLFPYPRNLRAEPSRLVSTKNGLPTVDDTIAVLGQGIPRTSMAANDHLNEDELRDLAVEVHRLRREGIRQRLVDEATLFEEQVDDADVEESAILLTTAGDKIVVPPIPPAAATAAERGRVLFLQQTCASCHGEDGAGDTGSIWYDERGEPVRAPDLIRDQLKGGQDASSIYLRIAGGMPGSPHPANIGLPERSLTDLVQFCLSLLREPKQILTDHQRAALAISQPGQVTQSTD